MVNFTKNQVWKDILTGCKLLIDICGSLGVVLLVMNTFDSLFTGSLNHFGGAVDLTKGAA